MPICELCEREVPAITRHHLYPKSRARRKGKPLDEIPMADFCQGCHKQLHRLFTNRELAERLTSVEAIRREPTMAKFLTWVRKQPESRRVRVR